jgi:hypothetical protein
MVTSKNSTPLSTSAAISTASACDTEKRGCDCNGNCRSRQAASPKSVVQAVKCSVCGKLHEIGQRGYLLLDGAISDEYGVVIAGTVGLETVICTRCLQALVVRLATPPNTPVAR